MEPSLLISFLPLFFLPLVVWGAMRIVSSRGNTVPPANPNATLAGINGWLALLIAGLMFFGPLATLANVYGDFSLLENQYPILKTKDNWTHLKMMTWITYISTVSLSFYAGLRLLKDRTISVIRQTKLLLWVIGPVSLVITGFVAPLIFIGSLSANAIGAFAGALIVSVLGATLWTFYLSKSKRVKATYGNDLSSGSFSSDPYSEIRTGKERFRSFTWLEVNKKQLRGGLATLVVYEFWLWFWAMYNEWGYYQNDNRWLIFATVVPVGALLSFVFYRWAAKKDS